MSDVFDHCDNDTTAVLDTGLDEARRMGHSWFGTEHVLLAIALHRDFLPGPVAQMLPDVEVVRAALLTQFEERPALPQGDLLATLGIDLDEVRAAVRRTFGTEALDRFRPPVHQPWQPWRRPSRACTSLLAGQVGVAPRLKQALELARHDPSRRQRAMIDPAGLLWGIVEVEGMAARVLLDVGVPPEDIRAALQEAPS